MNSKENISVSRRTKLLVSSATKEDGIPAQSESENWDDMDTNFEDRLRPNPTVSEVEVFPMEIEDTHYFLEGEINPNFGGDQQDVDLDNLPITIIEDIGDNLEIPVLESLPIEISQNVEIETESPVNSPMEMDIEIQLASLDEMPVSFEECISFENEEYKLIESISKKNGKEVSKNNEELVENEKKNSLFQAICGSDVDDTDSDPDWLPDSESNAKRQKIRERCSEEHNKSKDDGLSTHRNTKAHPKAYASRPTLKLAENEVGLNLENCNENENSENTIQCSKTSKCVKRMKGIRKREEEKLKKDQGLDYKNRKGVLFSAKVFKPVGKCCNKRKCDEKIKPEDQRKIFNDFYTLPVCARDQALADRIKISRPSVCRKKEDNSDTKVTRDRLVTVSYYITLDTTEIEVCKNMFMGVFGLNRGKVDVIIQKVKASSSGIIQGDMRGKHPQQLKTSSDEIEEINMFIDRYPRHESHYARRDSSSKKIFLPSNLNIKIMYKEYCEHRIENGHQKSACYDVFRKQFNAKGYKFKQPFIDTCNKCDEYILRIRHSTNKSDRQIISDMHDSHVKEAQEGYDMKSHDKNLSKFYDNRALLVFDLQQVLPVPYLSSNIAYYKRFLSMYNLTIRDCSNDQESSYCCMWSEIDAGRGSDDIASCVFKKLMDLPDNIEHVTTYSDTCGGQNRNINIATMFSYALTKKKTIQVIDQKFLLPGHTHLECDSDHARIERAKKKLHSSANASNSSDQYRIMVPRDWCQFVRTLSGRKKFKVIEMDQHYFKDFSSLLKNVLVHRKVDDDKQKVEWLKVRWLRYTQDFGRIYFKYDLNPFSPFRSFSILRGKKGRPENVEVARSYTRALPVNPKKKKDLLSMFNLIDPQFHSFYKKLATDNNSLEFDELDDLAEEDES